MLQMGQNAKNSHRAHVVCSSPDSAHSADIAGRHRNKIHLYSITSSARPSSVGGTVRPSALAVLRLIASGSNLTFESWKGFPSGSLHASLAHANRNFHCS